MHLSMVCPTLHTWGGWKEILPLESSPRVWYLVGIVPTHSHILFCCVKCLGKIISTTTYIS